MQIRMGGMFGTGELKQERQTPIWVLGVLFFQFYFIYIVLAVLGRLLSRCFSTWREQGYSLIVVCRFLIVVASLVAEHGF